MSSVKFIDKAVFFKGECPICLEDNKGDYFINHENSKHIPFHRACIQKCLNHTSPTCPLCRVPINNRLVTPLATVKNSANGMRKGAMDGARMVSGIPVFGTFAALTCAATILFGEWAARDVLAVSGGGYGMAYLAGLYAYFDGNGAGLQGRIEILAPIAAISASLFSLIPLAFRMTQQAYFFQGLAVYGLANSAGFKRSIAGGTMGLAASSALHYFFKPQAWDKTLITLIGGMGTLVNGIDSNWILSVVPSLAGMSASFSAFDDYGPIKAAMVGCVLSSIAASIFRQAFGDKRRVG